MILLPASGLPTHLLSRSPLPPFLFGNLYFLTCCLVFSSCAVCVPTFSWFLACLLSISDICPYISSYFLSPGSSLCTSASSLGTTCRGVPDSDLCSPFVASLSSVSSSSSWNKSPSLSASAWCSTPRPLSAVWPVLFLSFQNVLVWGLTTIPLGHAFLSGGGTG